MELRRKESVNREKPRSKKGILEEQPRERSGSSVTGHQTSREVVNKKVPRSGNRGCWWPWLCQHVGVGGLRSWRGEVGSTIA